MADPALIRGLAVGQAGYIYRGGVSYVQVKRLVAAPAAVAAQPAGTGRASQAADTAAAPGPPGPLPDVSEVLDAAFGPAP